MYHSAVIAESTTYGGTKLLKRKVGFHEVKDGTDYRSQRYTSYYQPLMFYVYLCSVVVRFTNKKEM